MIKGGMQLLNILTHAPISVLFLLPQREREIGAWYYTYIRYIL